MKDKEARDSIAELKGHISWLDRCNSIKIDECHYVNLQDVVKAILDHLDIDIVANEAVPPFVAKKREGK